MRLLSRSNASFSTTAPVCFPNDFGMRVTHDIPLFWDYIDFFRCRDAIHFLTRCP
jgi:hypothetical protein